MPVRRALHAGSWYTDSGVELSRQLEYWLNQADLSHGPARAIIAPHAGYQYCGACAGHAYRQISPVVVRRIFVLGPSHHVRLSGCALSSAQKYKTPLYDLHIDTTVNNELEKTGQFEWMDLDTDENEHSIEMHLPYIAKVMENYKNQFTIVPILVGSLSPEREAYYGRILAPYLADPKNLFVISSDFCHWGHRFRYTYYDRSYGNVYQSIEGLDRVGMNIIENLNPTEFTNYLKKYGNTICGRHPIGILLQIGGYEKCHKNYPSHNVCGPGVNKGKRTVYYFTMSLFDSFCAKNSKYYDDQVDEFTNNFLRQKSMGDV